MFRAAVGFEVEDCCFVELTFVQIAFRRDQLIAQGVRLGDNFPRGRDDDAAAHHIEAFFAARLGDADDPGPVLIRARLHGDVVVHHAQMERFWA